MEFKTTKFEVELNNLNYYLGIRSAVDIDFWVNNTDQWIEWKAVIISSQQGINNIYGIAKNVSFWVNYSIDLDDLKVDEEENLKENFNGEVYASTIHGQFRVNTMTEKDWKIDFSAEVDKNLIPKVVEVNFMDKQMEVL